MHQTARVGPVTPSSKKLLGALLACLLLLALGVRLLQPESYFFLYPAIDTHFAPGYSEARFQTIQPGMSRDEVKALLGHPLNNPSDPYWAYSEDGAFGWWDFAWLVRGVMFDEDGNVIGVSDFVAYD